MDTGRVVGGAILLVVAIWIFMTMSDPTAKYLGGVILGILGLALLITGSKEK
ncbi:MAG: hypothetical protein C5S44_12135 [Candidatus Methanocomedens sp.]|jgi:hypothetical protein|nr:MAG: hypothetical protein C5S44_12135 [ANME-2 cluster archaeon]NOR47598.1 hypothetical protein [Methanosarcinaceae archaeon]